VAVGELVVVDAGQLRVSRHGARGLDGHALAESDVGLVLCIRIIRSELEVRDGEENVNAGRGGLGGGSRAQVLNLSCAQQG
jgi:hypothetical protein